MEKLIEALQIFLKYSNHTYPTHCEHDVLYVVDVPVEGMTEEDVKKLDELGFHWDESEQHFYSYKYGSA